MAERIQGGLRSTADLATENLVRSAAAQGVEPLAVRLHPVVAQAPLVVAQTEAVGELVTGVSQDFKAQLRLQVRRSLAGGQTMDELQKAIGRALPGPGPFGKIATRAEVITRTEVTKTFQVAQQAQRETLASSGVTMRKQWLTARDGRVRPSHAALDGVTIPQDEDFDVGGWPAAYPMDPRLPAEESIQCRCSLATVFEEAPSPTPAGGVVV
jgi:uncharacterized protein with gpF-like domain